MNQQQVFHSLVTSVAHGRWAEAAKLYAADAVVSHPMSEASDLRGAAALERHFRDAAERLRGVLEFRPDSIRVHATSDPEVIIAEFSYVGAAVATGKSFAVPCVFVMRIKDGKILESRDYIHHQAFVAAVLGQA